MADSDKVITVTPNTSVATTHPEIKFVGKDNSPMYIKTLDDNTLSFEGAEGQVFSISPTLSSGDIFSVNDISGVQSIAVNADGTITLDAQTKSTTIKNNASNTSTLILQNTNADEVDGPILELYRNTVSPADGGDTGTILFTGKDDAGNKQEYGRITMEFDDVSSGNEEGELIFRLTEAGSVEQEYLRIRGSSRQIEFNTQQDDIDMTWNSDAYADVMYWNAGTGLIGINNNAPGYELDITGLNGGNGELRVLRTSGAAILSQAQSATGIVGTSTNHDFALMTNSSQRMKIGSGGGISAVSTTKGWNLWSPLIFGKRDYGTTAGSGAALHTLSTTAGEAGLNSYPLPANATLRAIGFMTSGVVLSGTTSQVWRVFSNGNSSTGTLVDTTLTCANFTRQNAENANATNHWYVVDGLNASYDKGETIGVKRESGAVDMGHIKVTLWWSFDN